MSRVFRPHRLIFLLLAASLAACSASPTSPSSNVPSNVSPQASGTPPPPSGTPAPSGSAASPNDIPDVPDLDRSSAPEPNPTPSPGAAGASEEVRDLRQNFFANYGINPFVEAATDPLSTFAADVDTASYAISRSYLGQKQMPPKASVRTEEFLNAFDYRYAQPLSGKFAIHTDLAPSYFGDGQTRLLRVGIQGQEILDRNRKAAHLTFVIDVSGSMNRENRLGLVKQSLKTLLDALRTGDSVGIVIYGSSARVHLAPTRLSNKALILAAIDNLRPEGSTNVEAGLQLGYAQATAQFQATAINRVILCSDGVANVGETGPASLLSKVRSESGKGINLTTLGFGMQGYNDILMEQLANQGDGNYAYIDSAAEAQKVLSEQITSTLQTIAKDVKLQVAFNPELVDQYRLLGYENRDVADEDFRNDTVDAGEVGSNHSVTALYELRFLPAARAGKVADITVRYQDVDAGNRVDEISQSVDANDLISFSAAPASLRLATAVAEFAEILRGSVFAADGDLSEVLALARGAESAFAGDPRLPELIGLIQQAEAINRPVPVPSPTNPAQLRNWESFLLKQLGGRATP